MVLIWSTERISQNKVYLDTLKDPEAETDAGERFQHETKLLSHATIGVSSLCVSCDLS